MAEYRITYYDGKIVRFSFKDYAEGGKTSFMTLKVHTVIGTLFGNWNELQYLFHEAGKESFIPSALLRPG